MRLIEVVEGEETSDETVQTHDQLRAADPQDADPLRRGAGLRREPHPELGRQRDLAPQGRVGTLGAGHRQGDRRRAGHADGPVLPERPARPRHGAARRRAPARAPTATASTCRPRCRASWRRATSARRPARASTTTARTGARDMEQATATGTGTVVERFTLKAFVEACLVLEEGVSSLREIETGMMTGAGILPGPVRARGRARPRRDARRARARRGRVGRSLRDPPDPAPPRRTGPARQEDRSGLLPLPAARRRTSTRRRPCCSRRAARSRSSGSTGRRPTRSARR